MGYLNENGLAHYDGLIKNWVAFKSGTVDGIDALLNWQKTETAGAVTCYPLPAAPLDPVVNFQFTETGPASGTKGPDNPSTIAGVTQAKVTRCGKNLIQFSSSPYESTKSGITLTSNGDGSYTLNGTATAQVKFNFSSINLHAGTYMLSGCPSGGSESTFSLATTGGIRDYGSGATIVLTSMIGRSPWIQIESGATVSNLVFKPQLELGSTATTFESYEGSDYTVNLGGTYYGGSIDLTTGLMTVTWWGEQINAAYTVYEEQTNTITVGIEASKGHDGNIDNIQNYLVTDRFPSINGSGDLEHCRFSGAPGVARFVFNMYINKSRLDVSAAVNPSSPTLAEWFAAANAWMHNNPVFACYKLFTPETVQLSPTQIYSLSQIDPYTPRINTVYSDQVSVQVGYPKSPIATASELTNAIVSLGSNL